MFEVHQVPGSTNNDCSFFFQIWFDPFLIKFDKIKFKFDKIQFRLIKFHSIEISFSIHVWSALSAMQY